MNTNPSNQPYHLLRANKAQYYYERRQHAVSSSQRDPQALPKHGAARRLYFSSSGFPSIDDAPQNIDQILRHGYMALPTADLETATIQDKQHTSWLGLDDILGQIHQRDEIYRRNMNELLWGECYAFNEFARGGWPPSPDQDSKYQERLADLAMQQRAERISAWRDTSALRQLLPESAQQYLSAFRKNELLRDLGGGDL